MVASKIISIALADDVRIFRKGLILCINTFKNCAVDIEAEDGADLITKLESTNNLPDVCILDISMPQMDGYVALKHIKNTWPQIKVIMLSMHYNEYSIIKSFQEGASACLPKEVNDDELYTAIIQSHEVGLYHSELTNQFISTFVLKQSINT